MRSIQRLRLPRRPSAWLERNQEQLNGDISIDVLGRWRARRQTMNGNGIVAALERMAGARNRCMYCGDSEGCDIEHFRPKAVHDWRGYVFSWINFLWICAPCNRLKNALFALDGVGAPLMLDPTLDHVWDFFDYVDESGQLSPRYDLGAEEALRANYTLRSDVSRLLFDVVCESRQRSARIIRRAVRDFLESAALQADVDNFIEHVSDADHPELCEWYFESTGATLAPYSQLCANHLEVIAALKRELNEKYPGVWKEVRGQS